MRSRISRAENEDKMSAEWQYNNDNVIYVSANDVENQSPYDVGWYAASPSNMEAGEEPNDGPFATEEQAITRAEELAIEERELNELINSEDWVYEPDNVVYADENDNPAHVAGWYAATPREVEARVSPDIGPFATRELAVTRAKKMVIGERELEKMFNGKV